jgi:hypothetical protein
MLGKATFEQLGRGDSNRSGVAPLALDSTDTTPWTYALVQPTPKILITKISVNSGACASLSRPAYPRGQLGGTAVLLLPTIGLHAIRLC